MKVGECTTQADRERKRERDGKMKMEKKTDV